MTVTLTVMVMAVVILPLPFLATLALLPSMQQQQYRSSRLQCLTAHAQMPNMAEWWLLTRR